MSLQFHLHYWPILTSVWILVTFTISYLVAIFKDHVYPFLPYLSDTGSLPPESCIFGQMLNMGALMLLTTIYIRFRTVELIRHRGFSKSYDLWNKSSNMFGVLSCLGMTLVANFQETSELNVHFIGAFLAFAVGAVYFMIQAYLTWLSYTNKLLKSVRILSSGLLLPLYVITTISGTLATEQLRGNIDVFKWTHKDAGYNMHLLSTISEWIMTLLMILYIATYYVEFKLVKFGGISFMLHDE